MKTKFKIEEIMDIIIYLKTNIDPSFKFFADLHSISYQRVDSMKRLLQRKKIIECHKTNGIDGKLISLKTVMIDDRDQIKNILGI